MNFPGRPEMKFKCGLRSSAFCHRASVKLCESALPAKRRRNCTAENQYGSVRNAHPECCHSVLQVASSLLLFLGVN